MKKFLILIGLSAIFFTSCKKEEDQKKVPYLGKWDLVYFTKNNQPEVYVPGDAMRQIRSRTSVQFFSSVFVFCF